MTKAPSTIRKLVDNFDAHLDSYRSGAYNETQVRNEFINPFFELLGWDVFNKAGYAEAYKDVVHEDVVKIGTATKAPDYSFRIGGVRKFFLEAKKPAVNIAQDVSPAYQLRRYAWSANLPLSILTDFEEFAVYDCRTKPQVNDKASVSRVMYLKCNEYIDRWDEIANIFSKDAVMKGSFDKYAQKGGRGTAQVDKEFLKEIESWREELAKNIALRNKNLSVRDLNFSVQRIIDRIIFLRMCEDRGIEIYGRLQQLMNGQNIYPRLRQFFDEADTKYNSGLFHFRKEKGRAAEPDELTPSLSIDDKPLKEIVRNLYYPASPYEFSVIGADILGNVYEQFLGKVIRLTASHQAKVEDKPEVKKAGGVYYTPKYIVDYIVKNTVGRLLGVEGLGDRGQRENVNHNSFTKLRGEQNESEIISRIDRMAEGDEFSGSSVRSNTAVSEDRTIRTDESDTASSSLDSGKHRGGIREETSQGISESSFHSDGITSRTGHSSGIDDSIEHAGKRKYDTRSTSTRGDRKTSTRSLSIPVATLNSNPKTLNPKQISKLRILDPACGSGSFLIGAYQYLLDYHRDWYVNDGVNKHTKEIYQGAGGEWRLTTTERKRILLNNIYGVDIDSQAVETTKLNLLLKVLEGENEQTLSKQFKMFHERALPDLGDNIKCGNSLIGPDFYEGQVEMLDDEERYRINAFDWKKEFKEIMDAGGFDCVIGNPPYGAVFNDYEGNYLKNSYRTFIWRGESYLVFVEKVLQLLRKGGMFGYIIPDTLLNLGFTQALRSYLLQNSFMNEIVVLPSKVFERATVDTILIFCERASYVRNFNQSTVRVKLFDKKSLINSLDQLKKQFDVESEIWFEQNSFNVQSDIKESSLLRKIDKQKSTIDQIANMYSGIKAYEVGKGSPSQTMDIREKKPFTSDTRRGNTWSPFFDGKHIGRYELFWNENNWIHYGKWLAAPRNPEHFSEEKILIRKIIGKTLIATYIPETSYCNTLLFVLKSKEKQIPLKYLLAILNSTLIGWYFRKKFQISADDTFPQIMIRDILQFPIPETPNPKPLTLLVDRMLTLHKQLAQAKNPNEKTHLQKEIEMTDNQIDKLVYELYGLTEEEIKIVEGGR